MFQVFLVGAPGLETWDPLIKRLVVLATDANRQYADRPASLVLLSRVQL
jgi:hypothetical protein